MSEFDHEYTDEIVCPWCGYIFSDSWKFSDFGEIECDCGKSFDYIEDVSVSYSTTRSKCKDRSCKIKLDRRPYIYNNKNWTIWKCVICDDKIYKVSKIVGNEPRLELPTLLDFK